MRQLRKEADIKQNVLAKEIGISASALRALESGKSIPKQSTIDSFCRVLKIPRVELIIASMSWDDMPERKEDREDVVDILSLAIHRIHKGKLRGATTNQVDHPAHYQKGGKECIDVMIEDFGKEAVVAFCKLNAFKYRWRAGLKEGNTADTDEAKAQWYEKKAEELCSE